MTKTSLDIVAKDRDRGDPDEASVSKATDAGSTQWVDMALDGAVGQPGWQDYWSQLRARWHPVYMFGWMPAVDSYWDNDVQDYYVEEIPEVVQDVVAVTEEVGREFTIEERDVIAEPVPEYSTYTILHPVEYAPAAAFYGSSSSVYGKYQSKRKRKRCGGCCAWLPCCTCCTCCLILLGLLLVAAAAIPVLIHLLTPGGNDKDTVGRVPLDITLFNNGSFTEDVANASSLQHATIKKQFEKEMKELLGNRSLGRYYDGSSIKSVEFGEDGVKVQYHLYFNLIKHSIPSKRQLRDILLSLERDTTNKHLGILGKLKFYIDSIRFKDRTLVRKSQDEKFITEDKTVRVESEDKRKTLPRKPDRDKESSDSSSTTDPKQTESTTSASTVDPHRFTTTDTEMQSTVTITTDKVLTTTEPVTSSTTASLEPSTPDVVTDYEGLIDSTVDLEDATVTTDFETHWYTEVETTTSALKSTSHYSQTTEVEYDYLSTDADRKKESTTVGLTSSTLSHTTISESADIERMQNFYNKVFRSDIGRFLFFIVHDRALKNTMVPNGMADNLNTREIFYDFLIRFMDLQKKNNTPIVDFNKFFRSYFTNNNTTNNNFARNIFSKAIFEFYLLFNKLGGPGTFVDLKTRLDDSKHAHVAPIDTDYIRRMIDVLNFTKPVYKSNTSESNDRGVNTIITGINSLLSAWADKRSGSSEDATLSDDNGNAMPSKENQTFSDQLFPTQNTNMSNWDNLQNLLMRSIIFRNKSTGTRETKDANTVHFKLNTAMLLDSSQSNINKGMLWTIFMNLHLTKKWLLETESEFSDKNNNVEIENNNFTRNSPLIVRSRSYAKSLLLLLNDTSIDKAMDGSFALVNLTPDQIRLMKLLYVLTMLPMKDDGLLESGYVLMIANNATGGMVLQNITRALFDVTIYNVTMSISDVIKRQNMFRILQLLQTWHIVQEAIPAVSKRYKVPQSDVPSDGLSIWKLMYILHLMQSKAATTGNVVQTTIGTMDTSAKLTTESIFTVLPDTTPATTETETTTFTDAQTVSLSLETDTTTVPTETQRTKYVTTNITEVATQYMTETSNTTYEWWLNLETTSSAFPEQQPTLTSIDVEKHTLPHVESTTIAVESSQKQEHHLIMRNLIHVLTLIANDDILKHDLNFGGIDPSKYTDYLEFLNELLPIKHHDELHEPIYNASALELSNIPALKFHIGNLLFVINLVKNGTINERDSLSSETIANPTVVEMDETLARIGLDKLMLVLNRTQTANSAFEFTSHSKTSVPDQVDALNVGEFLYILNLIRSRYLPLSNLDEASHTTSESTSENQYSLDLWGLFKILHLMETQAMVLNDTEFEALHPTQKRLLKNLHLISNVLKKYTNALNNTVDLDTFEKKTSTLLKLIHKLNMIPGKNSLETYDFSNFNDISNTPTKRSRSFDELAHLFLLLAHAHIHKDLPQLVDTPVLFYKGIDDDIDAVDDPIQRKNLNDILHLIRTVTLFREIQIGNRTMAWNVNADKDRMFWDMLYILHMMHSSGFAGGKYTALSESTTPTQTNPTDNLLHSTESKTYPTRAVSYTRTDTTQQYVLSTKQTEHASTSTDWQASTTTMIPDSIELSTTSEETSTYTATDFTDETTTSEFETLYTTAESVTTSESAVAYIEPNQSDALHGIIRDMVQLLQLIRNDNLFTKYLILNGHLFDNYDDINFLDFIRGSLSFNDNDRLFHDLIAMHIPENAKQGEHVVSSFFDKITGLNKTEERYHFSNLINVLNSMNKGTLETQGGLITVPVGADVPTEELARKLRTAFRLLRNMTVSDEAAIDAILDIGMSRQNISEDTFRVDNFLYMLNWIREVVSNGGLMENANISVSDGKKDEQRDLWELFHNYRRIKDKSSREVNLDSNQQSFLSQINSSLNHFEQNMRSTNKALLNSTLLNNLTNEHTNLLQMIHNLNQVPYNVSGFNDIPVAALQRPRSVYELAYLLVLMDMVSEEHRLPLSKQIVFDRVIDDEIDLVWDPVQHGNLQDILHMIRTWALFSEFQTNTSSGITLQFLNGSYDRDTAWDLLYTMHFVWHERLTQEAETETPTSTEEWHSSTETVSSTTEFPMTEDYFTVTVGTVTSDESLTTIASPLSDDGLNKSTILMDMIRLLELIRNDGVIKAYLTSNGSLTGNSATSQGGQTFLDFVSASLTLNNNKQNVHEPFLHYLKKNKTRHEHARASVFNRSIGDSFNMADEKTHFTNLIYVINMVSNGSIFKNDSILGKQAINQTVLNAEEAEEANNLLSKLTGFLNMSLPTEVAFEFLTSDDRSITAGDPHTVERLLYILSSIRTAVPQVDEPDNIMNRSVDGQQNDLISVFTLKPIVRLLKSGMRKTDVLLESKADLLDSKPRQLIKNVARILHAFANDTFEYPNATVQFETLQYLTTNHMQLLNIINKLNTVPNQTFLEKYNFSDFNKTTAIFLPNPRNVRDLAYLIVILNNMQDGPFMLDSKQALYDKELDDAVNSVEDLIKRRNLKDILYLLRAWAVFKDLQQGNMTGSAFHSDGGTTGQFWDLLYMLHLMHNMRTSDAMYTSTAVETSETTTGYDYSSTVLSVEHITTSLVPPTSEITNATSVQEETSVSTFPFTKRLEQITYNVTDSTIDVSTSTDWELLGTETTEYSTSVPTSTDWELLFTETTEYSTSVADEARAASTSPVTTMLPEKLQTSDFERALMYLLHYIKHDDSLKAYMNYDGKVIGLFNNTSYLEFLSGILSFNGTDQELRERFNQYIYDNSHTHETVTGNFFNRSIADLLNETKANVPFKKIMYATSLMYNGTVFQNNTLLRELIEKQTDLNQGSNTSMLTNFGKLLDDKFDFGDLLYISYLTRNGLIQSKHPRNISSLAFSNENLLRKFNMSVQLFKNDTRMNATNNLSSSQNLTENQITLMNAILHLNELPQETYLNVTPVDSVNGIPMSQIDTRRNLKDMAHLFIIMNKLRELYLLPDFKEGVFEEPIDDAIESLQDPAQRKNTRDILQLLRIWQILKDFNFRHFVSNDKNDRDRNFFELLYILHLLQNSRRVEREQATTEYPTTTTILEETTQTLTTEGEQTTTEPPTTTVILEETTTKSPTTTTFLEETTPALTTEGVQTATETPTTTVILEETTTESPTTTVILEETTPTVTTEGEQTTTEPPTSTVILEETTPEYPTTTVILEETTHALPTQEWQTTTEPPTTSTIIKKETTTTLTTEGEQTTTETPTSTVILEETTPTITTEGEQTTQLQTTTVILEETTPTITTEGEQTTTDTPTITVILEETTTEPPTTTTILEETTQTLTTEGQQTTTETPTTTVILDETTTEYPTTTAILEETSQTLTTEEEQTTTETPTNTFILEETTTEPPTTNTILEETTQTLTTEREQTATEPPTTTVILEETTTEYPTTTVILKETTTEPPTTTVILEETTTEPPTTTVILKETTTEYPTTTTILEETTPTLTTEEQQTTTETPTTTVILEETTTEPATTTTILEETTQTLTTEEEQTTTETPTTTVILEETTTEPATTTTILEETTQTLTTEREQTTTETPTTTVILEETTTEYPTTTTILEETTQTLTTEEEQTTARTPTSTVILEETTTEPPTTTTFLEETTQTLTTEGEKTTTETQTTTVILEETTTEIPTTTTILEETTETLTTEGVQTTTEPSTTTVILEETTTEYPTTTTILEETTQTLTTEEDKTRQTTTETSTNTFILEETTTDPPTTKTILEETTQTLTAEREQTTTETQTSTVILEETTIMTPTTTVILEETTTEPPTTTVILEETTQTLTTEGEQTTTEPPTTTVILEETTTETPTTTVILEETTTEYPTTTTILEETTTETQTSTVILEETTTEPPTTTVILEETTTEPPTTTTILEETTPILRTEGQQTTTEYPTTTVILEATTTEPPSTTTILEETTTEPPTTTTILEETAPTLTTEGQQTTTETPTTTVILEETTTEPPSTTTILEETTPILTTEGQQTTKETPTTKVILEETTPALTTEGQQTTTEYPTTTFILEETTTEPPTTTVILEETTTEPPSTTTILEETTPILTTEGQQTTKETPTTTVILEETTTTYPTTTVILEETTQTLTTEGEHTTTESPTSTVIQEETTTEPLTSTTIVSEITSSVTGDSTTEYDKTENATNNYIATPFPVESQRNKTARIYGKVASLIRLIIADDTKKAQLQIYDNSTVSMASERYVNFLRRIFLLLNENDRYLLHNMSQYTGENKTQTGQALPDHFEGINSGLFNLTMGGASFEHLIYIINLVKNGTIYRDDGVPKYRGSNYTDYSSDFNSSLWNTFGGFEDQFDLGDLLYISHLTKHGILWDDSPKHGGDSPNKDHLTTNLKLIMQWFGNETYAMNKSYQFPNLQTLSGEHLALLNFIYYLNMIPERSVLKTVNFSSPAEILTFPLNKTRGLNELAYMLIMLNNLQSGRLMPNISQQLMSEQRVDDEINLLEDAIQRRNLQDILYLIRAWTILKPGNNTTPATDTGDGLSEFMDLLYVLHLVQNWKLAQHDRDNQVTTLQTTYYTEGEQTTESPISTVILEEITANITSEGEQTTTEPPISTVILEEITANITSEGEQTTTEPPISTVILEEITANITTEGQQSTKETPTSTVILEETTLTLTTKSEQTTTEYPTSKTILEETTLTLTTKSEQTTTESTSTVIQEETTTESPTSTVISEETTTEPLTSTAVVSEITTSVSGDSTTEYDTSENTTNNNITTPFPVESQRNNTARIYGKVASLIRLIMADDTKKAQLQIYDNSTVSMASKRYVNFLRRIFLLLNENDRYLLHNMSQYTGENKAQTVQTLPDHFEGINDGLFNLTMGGASFENLIYIINLVKNGTIYRDDGVPKYRGSNYTDYGSDFNSSVWNTFGGFEDQFDLGDLLYISHLTKHGIHWDDSPKHGGDSPNEDHLTTNLKLIMQWFGNETYAMNKSFQFPNLQTLSGEHLALLNFIYYLNMIPEMSVLKTVNFSSPAEILKLPLNKTRGLNELAYMLIMLNNLQSGRLMPNISQQLMYEQRVDDEINLIEDAIQRRNLQDILYLIRAWTILKPGNNTTYATGTGDGLSEFMDLLYVLHLVQNWKLAQNDLENQVTTLQTPYHTKEAMNATTVNITPPISTLHTTAVITATTTIASTSSDNPTVSTEQSQTTHSEHSTTTRSMETTTSPFSDTMTIPNRSTESKQTSTSSTTLDPDFKYLWHLSVDDLGKLFPKGVEIKQPDEDWNDHNFTDIDLDKSNMSSTPIKRRTTVAADVKVSQGHKHGSDMIASSVITGRPIVLNPMSELNTQGVAILDANSSVKEVDNSTSVTEPTEHVVPLSVDTSVNASWILDPTFLLNIQKVWGNKTLIDFNSTSRLNVSRIPALMNKTSLQPNLGTMILNTALNSNLTSDQLQSLLTIWNMFRNGTTHSDLLEKIAQLTSSGLQLPPLHLLWNQIKPIVGQNFGPRENNTRSELFFNPSNLFGNTSFPIDNQFDASRPFNLGNVTQPLQTPHSALQNQRIGTNSSSVTYQQLIEMINASHGLGNTTKLLHLFQRGLNQSMGTASNNLFTLYNITTEGDRLKNLLYVMNLLKFGTGQRNMTGEDLRNNLTTTDVNVLRNITDNEFLHSIDPTHSHVNNRNLLYILRLLLSQAQNDKPASSFDRDLKANVQPQLNATGGFDLFKTVFSNWLMSLRRNVTDQSGEVPLVGTGGALKLDVDTGVRATAMVDLPEVLNGGQPFSVDGTNLQRGMNLSKLNDMLTVWMVLNNVSLADIMNNPDTLERLFSSMTTWEGGKHHLNSSKSPQMKSTSTSQDINWIASILQNKTALHEIDAISADAGMAAPDKLSPWIFLLQNRSFVGSTDKRFPGKVPTASNNYWQIIQLLKMMSSLPNRTTDISLLLRGLNSSSNSSDILSHAQVLQDNLNKVQRDKEALSATREVVNGTLASVRGGSSEPGDQNIAWSVSDVSPLVGNATSMSNTSKASMPLGKGADDILTTDTTNTVRSSGVAEIRDESPAVTEGPKGPTTMPTPTGELNMYQGDTNGSEIEPSAENRVWGTVEANKPLTIEWELHHVTGWKEIHVERRFSDTGEVEHIGTVTADDHWELHHVTGWEEIHIERRFSDTGDVEHIGTVTADDHEPRGASGPLRISSKSHYGMSSVRVVVAIAMFTCEDEASYNLNLTFTSGATMWRQDQIFVYSQALARLISPPDIFEKDGLGGISCHAQLGYPERRMFFRVKFRSESSPVTVMVPASAYNVTLPDPCEREVTASLQDVLDPGTSLNGAVVQCGLVAMPRPGPPPPQGRVVTSAPKLIRIIPDSVCRGGEGRVPHPFSQCDFIDCRHSMVMVCPGHMCFNPALGYCTLQRA